MKNKIFIVCLILLIAAKGVLAQSSQLTIFHQNGERFWVIVDGIKYNAQPQASIFIPDLNKDFLRVKIIFENEKIPDIDKNIQTRDVDNNYVHSKYIIKPEKNKTVMRLHSFEPIVVESTQPVKTQPINQQPVETTQVKPPTTTTTTTTQTNITQKPNETFSMGTTVIDPETGKPISMDVSISVPTNETDQFGVSTTSNTPEGNFTTQTQVTTTQTTVTHRENYKQPVQHNQNDKVEENVEVYKMPGYNGKIGCSWPMSEMDFSDAKRSISSKTFEDSKLTIAKQITSSNCLLCTQVKDIMNLFDFESTKLEFAKYAYDFVYDLNNFYKINDAFTFESSIDELNEYINKKSR